MKADCHSIEKPQEDISKLLSCHNVSPSPPCKLFTATRMNDCRQSLLTPMEGERFRCRVFHHVTDVSHFAAMAIRCLPSQDEPQMVFHPSRQLLNRLTQAIEQVCKGHGGIWERINQDTFACLLPVKNRREGKMLLDTLQADLPQRDGSLLCMGTAWYPTLNFNRCQILSNAEQSLEHALLLGPGNTVTFDAISLNISGDHYYQAGDYQQARKAFQLALQFDPLNVNVHNSMGVCYGMSGCFEKASEAFETALWLDPKEVMALHNAGIIHQMQGKDHIAVDLLQQAFRLDPNIFENAFHAGILSLKINQPRQAADYLQKAVQLNPDKAIAWRFLAESHEKCGDDDHAIRAYKQAIKRNPADAAALSGLGYLYYKNNRNLEIATVFCHESTLLEPDNASYRQRLGEIHLKHNNDDAALLEFRQAQALGLDSEYWIEQIEMYSQKGPSEK